MRDYRGYPAQFVEQTAPTKVLSRSGPLFSGIRNERSGAVDSNWDRLGGDLWRPGLRCLLHSTIEAATVGSLAGFRQSKPSQYWNVDYSGPPF